MVLHRIFYHLIRDERFNAVGMLHRQCPAGCYFSKYIMYNMEHLTSGSPQSGCQLPYKRRQTQLEDHFELHRAAGTLLLKTAGLRLQFPMLVIRHGQTDGNLLGQFQGHADGPQNQLNAVGQAQAQDTARLLYGELQQIFGEHLLEAALSNRLKILASPITRAQETTRAFVEYFRAKTDIHLPVHTEARLAEIHFGAIEGRTEAEIHDAALREAAQRYRRQDVGVNWQGTGESFYDVVTRAYSLLEELNRAYREQAVVVMAFAHGVSINALRAIVGDRAVLDERGCVAFRKHFLENGEPYWLGESRDLLARVTHCLTHLDSAAVQ